MIRHIESKDNKYVKLVKSLSQKKYREKYGLFAAEGKRIVEEALRYALSDIEFIMISESFADKNPDFLRDDVLLLTVADGVFKTVCNTENSQGALAAIKMSDCSHILENPRFALVLDGVSEPGNMGTIIRTAEAMGVDIIYTIGDCVDVYNPKVVRSTMGSIFRVSIISEDGDTLFSKLKAADFTICASSLSADKDISDIPYRDKIALVIGSEASGISSETESEADILFKIPMRGKTESLNASVASGIALYELGGKVLW